MRIWSILLIKPALKWCIHLRRSLYLYFNHVTSIKSFDFSTLLYNNSPREIETRAPKGHWSLTWVQKSTSVITRFKGKKCDYRMEPKTTTLHNTCSRLLLWIWFDAVAFQSKKVFWRRGPPPGDLFGLALDPPRGRYGLNIFMNVPGHEHFIPTKFREHPLSGSVVKAGYVFPYIYMH